MEFAIEKNVKMPIDYGKGKKYHKYPFGKMKVGDKDREIGRLSFELNKKDDQLKQSLLLYQNMCDQITKDQKQLDYWKARCEAADKVFSSYKEWTDACKDKSHSSFSVSLMYKIYEESKTKYEKLKQQP